MAISGDGQRWLDTAGKQALEQLGLEVSLVRYESRVFLVTKGTPSSKHEKRALRYGAGKGGVGGVDWSSSGGYKLEEGGEGRVGS